MNKIAGVEVSDQTYREYAQKKYRVPSGGSYSAQVIELYATSQSVRQADPELQEECKAVLEQIRKEVEAEQVKQTGLRFQTRHTGFSEYLGDLDGIYITASAAREELRQRHDKKVSECMAIERGSDSGTDRALAKAERQKANETYQEELKILQEKTGEAVQAVRDAYNRHVEEFYGADSTKIDNDTVKLLQSGLRLTESEVVGLFEKYPGNPTMLRLLSDYCDQNNIKVLGRGNQQTIAVMTTLARSNGKTERDAFEYVAAQIVKAVSADEVISSIWCKADNYGAISDSTAESLERSIVRPDIDSVVA